MSQNRQKQIQKLNFQNYDYLGSLKSNYFILPFVETWLGSDMQKMV